MSPLVTIPFVAIAGLVVVFIYLNWIRDGYKAPGSVRESVTRIAANAGSIFAGAMLLTLLTEGFSVADWRWEWLLGILSMVPVLFGVDMWAMKRERSQEQS